VDDPSGRPLARSLYRLYGFFFDGAFQWTGEWMVIVQRGWPPHEVEDMAYFQFPLHPSLLEARKQGELSQTGLPTAIS